MLVFFFKSYKVSKAIGKMIARQCWKLESQQQAPHLVNQRKLSLKSMVRKQKPQHALHSEFLKPQELMASET